MYDLNSNTAANGGWAVQSSAGDATRVASFLTSFFGAQDITLTRNTLSGILNNNNGGGFYYADANLANTGPGEGLLVRQELLHQEPCHATW